MRTLFLALAVFLLLDSPATEAQMFGQARQVGRPLSRRPQPAAAEAVGTVTGAERFLRNNRDRASFVGADKTEGQGFVGNQQARTAGSIVSSTASIKPAADRSRQINRPMRRPTAGQMQLPKLTLNLGEMSSQQLITLESEHSVIARVRQAVRLATELEILVSVEGRTAILRGVVDSDEERRLAETMVSFEPGISNVQNLLQTQSDHPSQSQPLPPPGSLPPPR